MISPDDKPGPIPPWESWGPPDPTIQPPAPILYPIHDRPRMLTHKNWGDEVCIQVLVQRMQEFINKYPHSSVVQAIIKDLDAASKYQMRHLKLTATSEPNLLVKATSRGFVKQLKILVKKENKEA